MTPPSTLVILGLGLALLSLDGLAERPAAAPADQAAPAALSPQDSADVARAVAYLEGLTTARGRFIQTDPRGAQSAGAFVLQRPGKARFDYDPPSGLVIAADGRQITVVDNRLRTIQVLPLGATPLGLFLARDIRLDRGVKVTRVTREAGRLQIVAEDAHKSSRGRIALDFAESPLSLTGWTVTDARGGVVKVRLEGFERSSPRESAFFVLTDPRRASAGRP